MVLMDSKTFLFQNHVARIKLRYICFYYIVVEELAKYENSIFNPMCHCISDVCLQCTNGVPLVNTQFELLPSTRTL